MKHSFSPLVFLIASVLALFLLNSCYFNSAGHIFDLAGHAAAVDMGDIRPGTNIYTDSWDYYVELPRYRADTPVVTQYPDSKQEENSKVQVTRTDETVFVKLPKDYAYYLIGRSNSGPTIPAAITIMEGDASYLRRNDAYSATRQPANHLCKFKYSSPAAGWWYTLGVLDWLCVDLPITCVENAIVIPVGFIYFIISNTEYHQIDYSSLNTYPSGNSSAEIDGTLDYLKQQEKYWIEMQRASGNIPQSSLYQ